MPRMTTEEARAFWALSPEVRHAVAARNGFFKNDYEDSLRISEAHAQALDQTRFQDEIGPSRLDGIAA